MFRNQLIALEHPTPDSIDFNDRTQFASTVLWVEDQKIRLYKIEDREALRQVATTDNWLPAWNIAYEKYKSDVAMPTFGSPTEEMSWLLSTAVRLEYMDNADDYANITAEVLEKSERSAKPTVASSNPLDNLDMESDEFRKCVSLLAEQLSIGAHPNHHVRLQAIAYLIHKKLRPDADTTLPVGMAFPIKEGGKCEFDDKDVDQAAKILRLLQIHNVRALQTVINETIVTVQRLTADPKTDSKLGKVGF